MTQTRKVLNLIAKKGAMSNMEITEELGINKHSVRRITGQETLKGNLVRCERGVYDVTSQFIAGGQEPYNNF